MPKTFIRWILLPLGIVIGGWLAFEQFDLDDSPESWVLLKLFHSGPWYFEMKVDLQYGQDEVHVERVVECKPMFARKSYFGYRSAWYKERYAISQQLPDGSGVMIVTPDVCSKNVKIKYGFDPLIMWVDNADDPQFFEAYFDPNLLKNGKAHVQLESIEIVAPTHKLPSEYPDDFADWNILTRDPYPRGKAIRFRAAFANDMPTSAWAEDDSIVPELKKRDKTTIVNDPLRISLRTKVFSFDTDLGPIEAGWYATNELRSLEGLLRHPLYSIRMTYPLRIVGDELFLDQQARGVVVYYNVESRMRAGKIPPFPNMLRLDTGVVGELEDTYNFLWLPAENRLMQITAVPILLVRRPLSE